MCCVLNVVYRASVVLGVERSMCCGLSVVYRASVVLGVERSMCCGLSVVYRASVVLGVERSVCCVLNVVYRASVVLGVERSMCCGLSVVYRASVVLGVERSVCCELSVVLLVRMLLTFYLLFIGLHVSEGCALERSGGPQLSITAQKRGSALLPCYCTDLNTKPEALIWRKYNSHTNQWEDMSLKGDQYRDRVQLFNGHSPGNLSLLISHLTEEDGGDYRCEVKDSHISIRLTLKGCNLVNREQALDITAHIGGSVLLPCYCTDLQTTPEEFRWTKDNTKTGKRENISSQSGQYRNRVQLVNGHSPGNLSLLISHLTEEDGGVYMCGVKGAHLMIRLTLKEGPPTITPTRAVVSVQTRPATSTTHSTQKPDGYSIHFSIFIPVLLLLLGLGGLIYWRCRGRRRGQTESREERRTKIEQKTQDEVMYSTVVHSNTTTTTTTVIDIEEKAEYATIRVN
uniref:Ig-like domain-containing protein n=2 Tax=Pygocentrus nattereri TaxID=42514 RepID=A0AAR2M4N8_PYGNA